MSINRVNISGNLTRDPELRSTAAGTSVLTFGVAVNDRRKNQQTGEWEDYPNFIDCTLFGARAEKLAQYLHKGIKVAIEGKLHWSQWERDGQKRSKVDVTVDDIEFMSAREQQPTYASQQYQPPQQQYPTHPNVYAPHPAPVQAVPYPATQPVYAAPAQPASIYDEDIPF